MTTRRLLGLVAAALVLFAPTGADAQVTIGGPKEAEAPAPSDEGGANLEVISQDQALTASDDVAIRNYWTSARLRAAVSKDLLVSPAAAGARGGARAFEGEGKGPVNIWSSTLPGEKGTKRTLSPADAARLLGASSLAASGPEAQAGNGTPPSFPAVTNAPFVYTRYRLFADNAGVRTTSPWRTVGKLFFTIPGQGNFQCSASSIASENLSTVWTAGHCVYTPGVGFHSNFLFIPGYHAHLFGPVEQPFGSWTALTSVTLGGWTAGLFEYDHGTLVLNRGGLGVPDYVNNRVGGLGFITHFPRFQHWHLLGYPAALQSPPSPGPGFDGGHVEVCSATFAVNDQPTGAPGVDPPTIGVGCDQTGGTSGGPWVVDLSGSPGFNNLLNGNNSYRYVGCAPGAFCNLELYGPYFSDGAYILKIFSESIFVP
jgi:V8-like Glu-specific endopeptidase